MSVETLRSRNIAVSRANVSRLQSPYLVGIVVAVLYLGLLVWLWGHFKGDPLGFVHRGTIFTEHNPAGTWGYDGQFYYYTAVDPFNAAQYMDNPTFRLQRIFYPMVLIALSFGQRDLVPYAMILVNYLSVVGGTLLVALLLKRWGRSPWFALAYALCSGIPVALTFDTAEPLTFALAALGIYFWDRSRPLATPAGAGNYELRVTSYELKEREDRGRESATPQAESVNWKLEIWGTLAFAAALLTRELALYFVLAIAGVALVRREWRRLLLALASFVPLFAWSAYLSITSHYLGASFAQPFEHIPFLAYWLQLGHPTVRSVAYAAQYIVPTVIFGLLAIWQLVRTWREGRASQVTGDNWFMKLWSRFGAWPGLTPMLVAVLGNAHLMTFLFKSGYQHQVAVSRYSLGLALAAVLWAGSAKPRWLLWLTPIFAFSLLVFLYGLLHQDPAYLW